MFVAQNEAEVDVDQAIAAMGRYSRSAAPAQLRPEYGGSRLSHPAAAEPLSDISNSPTCSVLRGERALLVAEQLALDQILGIAAQLILMKGPFTRFEL